MQNFPSPHLPLQLMKMFFLKVISIHGHGPKVMRSSSLLRRGWNVPMAADESFLPNLDFTSLQSIGFTSLRTV